MVNASRVLGHKHLWKPLCIHFCRLVHICLSLIIAMGLMAIGGFMAYWGIVTRLTFWTRHECMTNGAYHMFVRAVDGNLRISTCGECYYLPKDGFLIPESSLGNNVLQVV